MKKFACIESVGRRFKEPIFLSDRDKISALKSKYFETDRNKILYSESFKNLQNKNAMLNHLSSRDKCRNVFAKTISLSYLTRTLSSLLGINQDLSEVISLVYSLGSPIFSYAGQKFANEINKEEFTQTFFAFKIVTQIENFSSEYSGINLSKEILESILKCTYKLNHIKIPEYIKEYQTGFDLDLYSPPLLECQLFEAVKDFMFLINDLEDSLSSKLISIWDLHELDFLVEYAERLFTISPNISDKSLIFEIGRLVVQNFFQDLVLCTEKKILDLGIETLEDVKKYEKKIISISSMQLKKIDQLKQFLIEKVYMTPKVVFIMKKFTRILHKLYELYQNDIIHLPTEFKKMIESNPLKKDSIILDYILYMNDHLAIRKCKKFFNIDLDETGF